MIGIYLLVTIFAQFSPSYLFSPDYNSMINAMSTGSSHGAALPGSHELSLVANFDQLNGVKIGTAIISDGRKVGVVTGVGPAAEGRSRDANRYQVNFNINAAASALHRGTIALQTAPMTSKVRPETVVELVLPPGESSTAARLQAGEVIAGFSSLEKFWTAAVPSSRRRI